MFQTHRWPVFWISLAARTVASFWPPSRQPPVPDVTEWSDAYESALEPLALPENFWEQKCPKRKKGNYNHLHAPTCSDGHLPDQCCYCGGIPDNSIELDVSQLTPEEYSRLKRVAQGVAAGYYKP